MGQEARGELEPRAPLLARRTGGGGESKALTYREHLQEDFESTNLISKAIFLRLGRLRQLLPLSPDRKMFECWVFLNLVSLFSVPAKERNEREMGRERRC